MRTLNIARQWAAANPGFVGELVVQTRQRDYVFYAVGGEISAAKRNQHGQNGACAVCGRVFLALILNTYHFADPYAGQDEYGADGAVQRHAGFANVESCCPECAAKLDMFPGPYEGPAIPAGPGVRYAVFPHPLMRRREVAKKILPDPLTSPARQSRIEHEERRMSGGTAQPIKHTRSSQ